MIAELNGWDSYIEDEIRKVVSFAIRNLEEGEVDEPKVKRIIMELREIPKLLDRFKEQNGIESF